MAAIAAAWGLAGCLHLARPDRDTHAYAAPLPGDFTYAFNADSAAFARIVVRFPEGLWDCEQGRVRLLRPLYPALGRLLYLPLIPLAPCIPDTLAARVATIKARAHRPEIWAGVDDRRLLLAWTALVGVNLGLALLASWLTLRALGRFLPGPDAFCLCLLAVFHANAIDFILVPHTELLNLLVPALTLDALTRGRGQAEPARATALLLGGLMLGKALAFPVLGWLKGRTRREAAVLLGLFILPGALYAAGLAAAGLPLYNHEVVHYRQGVWMLDWVREGRGAAMPLRWVSGLWTHLTYLAHLTAGFGVPLLAGAALLLKRPRGPAPAPWLATPLLLYGISCAAFWALLGYDAARLSVLHAPWIMAALGTLASARLEKPVRFLAAVAALHALSRFAA